MRWVTAAIVAWGVLSGTAWAKESAVKIGDPQIGKEVFRKCRTCHEVGVGAKHRVGPILNGIFDRKVAQFDDYNYSKAMRRARKDGMAWDLDHLDAYVENPKALVSGTKMRFKGLKDATERGHLLAFLRQFSDNPQDIPEAAPTARKVEVKLSPEVLAIVGDVDYGEYLSSECTTCHQVDGDFDGIPAITGWPDEDFVVAMHAYKRKIRPHPVMQMMSGRLSDEEIAALAAFFGALD